MLNRCAIHLQQCKYHMHFLPHAIHMHITSHMEQIQLTRCTSYVKPQHMRINMYFLPVLVEPYYFCQKINQTRQNTLVGITVVTAQLNIKSQETYVSWLS